MIDIPTVFTLISVLSLTLGVAIRIAQTTERKWGLEEFSYGMICHGIAYGLYTLSPRLGHWTVWFAEVSIAVFFSFAIQSFEVFYGKNKHWVLHGILIGSIALSTFVLIDNRPIRIMCNSMVFIAAEAFMLHRVWRRRKTTPGRGQHLIAAAILLSLTTLFYREVMAFLTLHASGEITVSDLSQAVLYIATVMSLTLITVGVLLMNKERTDHLNQLMILRDKLTGVWNRQKLEEVGEGEVQRLVRHGTLTSMLMLDLDDFKKINDTLGHAAGDTVLQAVTSSWLSILKPTDILGRWGGEEFIIILPGTGENDALLIAETLRAVTNTTSIAGIRGITVSIGVSPCLSHDSWKSWFDRADAALYRAKAAGKNQVCHDIPIEWQDGTSLIHWSPLFESGHEELDKDHRQLVERANQLLRTVRANGDKATVTQYLNEIGLDMRRHFAREELVIADLSPSSLQRHRAEHAAMLERLAFLTDRFLHDALPLEALVQFVAFEMCAHHIAGSDRRILSRIPRSERDRAIDSASL